MSRNVAIAFIVYDGYEDLWDDAIRCIDKFWPNHPQIYMFTNAISHNWDNVKSYPVGVHAEWSMKVQKAVEVIEEDYFILLLEDFFIGASVDNNEFSQLMDYIEGNDIVYCKLCDNNRILPSQKPKYDNETPFQIIRKNQKYGICLQPAIWNKNFLKALVGEGNYNAWVFELNQIKNAMHSDSKPFEKIIFDPRNILHFKHGALQGEMLPSTVWYFKHIKFPLSSNRKVMSKLSYLKYIVKHLGRDLTPQIFQKYVKYIARIMGFSFVDDKWN